MTGNTKKKYNQIAGSGADGNRRASGERSKIEKSLVRKEKLRAIFQSSFVPQKPRHKWHQACGMVQNMEDMKEFVAYSRKLLRILKRVKSALREKNYDEAEKLVDELIEDTEGDIQA